MKDKDLQLILLVAFLFGSKYFQCKHLISKNDFIITEVDIFPHNINQDFSINIHHPNITTHHLYSVIILEVNMIVDQKKELIIIFPGYLPKSEGKLKENYFHLQFFETDSYNTKIVIRLFRSSQGGELLIMYSHTGAENIHNEMPTDSIIIYKEKIQLFRPPIVDMIIKTEDDHRKGLLVNKRALIICSAKDGFPPSDIDITFQKSLIIKKETRKTDIFQIEFIAQLKDHFNKITCTCGGVSITKQINIFHHPSGVEIVPSDTLYIKQNSNLTCKSIGGGYPNPIVKWTVNNTDKINKDYFTIISSKFESVLTINSNVPNLTQWNFNCSSLNYIPHLVHGGAWKSINITIGENPEAARLAINRLWTITVVSVIVLIVFLIGLLCFGSKFRCRSKSKGTSRLASCPDDSLSMTDRVVVSNGKLDEYEDEDNNQDRQERESFCKNSFFV